VEDDPDLRETEPDAPLGRLTNPQALSFERFLIRTRDGTSTQSAWRLSIGCAEGQGAIIFIEISPDQTFFRGEGIFLGWSQQQMSAAYSLLLPKSDDPPFEIPQGG
jgi:hypothetical protein